MHFIMTMCTAGYRNWNFLTRMYGTELGNRHECINDWVATAVNVPISNCHCITILEPFARGKHPKCRTRVQKLNFFPICSRVWLPSEHGTMSSGACKVFVVPSNGSQHDCFLTDAALPVVPAKKRLLSQSLAAPFNDAKRVQCSIVVELDVERPTIVEEGLGASKIEPNVVLPMTSLRTSLERH